MAGWKLPSRPSGLILALIASVIYLCIAALGVLQLLSDPRRPVIFGDPAPESKTVILHNKAVVPLLVFDDGSYASRLHGLRMAPGETIQVDVGYVSNFGDDQFNQLCLRAETDDLHQTFYQCLTMKELANAAWTWDITTNKIEPR
jgi:hypothetical protein